MRRGSVGTLYAFALFALLALTLAAVSVGRLLEAQARARGAAEAAVYAALSARDWVAAQACGCPRLDVGEARRRVEEVLIAALTGQHATWAVAVEPGGVVTASVVLSTPTSLGWLGLPAVVPLQAEAGGRLEWWDTP
jgi:Flp pilus assembly protein TadG